MPPPPQVAYIEAGKLHKTEGNRPHGSGKPGLKGMSETIRHLGILVPLLIRPHPRREGHYVILDGNRRYKAGLMAGLSEFPCTLRRVSGAEKIAGPVLTEVVVQTQRVPWGPVEFALKLGLLRDNGLTQADISRFTGLAESTISHHMELLDLDGDTLQNVREGKIPVGAAHDAVKTVRAAAPPPRPGPREITRRRPAAGSKPKPRPHFDATHPLAAAAHALCTGRGHQATSRLNKTACGSCWESAIRTDQDHQSGREIGQPQQIPAAPVAMPVRQAAVS